LLLARADLHHRHGGTDHVSGALLGLRPLRIARLSFIFLDRIAELRNLALKA
jgi:hypothetical protein